MSTPTRAAVSGRPAINRLPSSLSRLAGELLDALVAEVDGQDVAAIRAEHLRQLSRADEVAWTRAMDALDGLIGALRAREAALARGDIVRPAPVAPPQKPPVAPPAEPASPSRLPKSYLPIAEPAPSKAKEPPPPPEAEPTPVALVEVADDEFDDAWPADPITKPELPIPPPPPPPSTIPRAAVRDDAVTVKAVTPPVQALPPAPRVPALPVSTPPVPAHADTTHAVSDAEFSAEPDDRLATAATGGAATSGPPPEVTLDGDFESEVAEVLPPPPPPVRADEFHERSTVILSALSEADIAAAMGTPPPPPKPPGSVRVEPLPPAEPATPAARPPAVPAPVQPSADAQRDDAPRQAGWTRRAELLFEDALRLFRLGDSDGGLISLERLLVSTELNADLIEFIEVNQERILELYEAVLSPWKKIAERMDEIGAAGLAVLVRLPKMASVLALVNGRDNVEVIVRAAEARGLRKLEIIAALSQLARSKVIRLR